MSDITELPIVDTAALNELKELAGDECLGIYQDFFNELSNQLSALETAQGSADHATIKSISHSIKGSASSLGMLRLAKYASIIEEAAKIQQTTSMDELASCGIASQNEVAACFA